MLHVFKRTSVSAAGIVKLVAPAVTPLMQGVAVKVRVVMVDI